MTRDEQEYRDACASDLLPLVGLPVDAIVISEDGYVGLSVGKYTVWFSQDPEGNGPGFPAVEEQQHDV